MFTYRINILLVLILLFAATAFGQNPTKWTLSVESSEGKILAGETYKGKLAVEVEAGWYLYALDQPSGGPIATTSSMSG